MQITEAVTCVLDRPAVFALALVERINGVWTIELDLTEDQADGLACIRCSDRGGAVVPVGYADRPLGQKTQVFAHLECISGT